MPTRAWLQHDAEDVILCVVIQPRASKDEIVGPQGDELKIRITSPPVDGKANAQLIAFLAKTFKVAKSRVLIEAGETGRHKRVRIRSVAQLPDILQ